MAGGWLRCRACRRETSITAGTIFEGTRKPLRTWFLAIWFVTSQKNGMSALGLQRALGLGSYETSWTWLHKLRRAMVRPGRDHLAGEIEADETYVGGPEEGKRGREVESKAIIAVAAEQRGRGIGRIRLRRVKDVSAESLLAFLQEAVEPGAKIHTDGWRSYAGLPAAGYRHQVTVISGGSEPAHEVRPQSRRPAQTVVVGDSPGRHPAPTSRRLPRRIHLPLVWGFGCQALNVGIEFLPVSSSSRWRQPSRGLAHDVPRGARPLARIIAPQACIRWTRGDPDHDAAMRIGGEAPGRRAHSSMRHESHRKARVTATSDRHRQPAGEPWAGRETVSGAPLRPSPLTPPDAGRHRPASRRWSPNATAR